MKYSLWIALILTANACTRVPSADELQARNGPVTPAEKTKVDVKPATKPTTGNEKPRSEEDLRRHEDSQSDRHLANAKLRDVHAAAMAEARDWRSKLAPASEWMIRLDHQEWKPQKSYRSEVDQRQELFDSSLRDFFTLWNQYSIKLSRSDRENVDVDARASEVQNLVALAIAMDRRNPNQDSIARRYGFESMSVFGIIRDTLIQKKHKHPTLSHHSLIAEREALAIESLEWRANALYMFALESALKSTSTGGLLGSSQIKLEKLTSAEIANATNLMYRANYAVGQLAQIKGSVVINGSLKSSYGRLKIDRLEKDIRSETDAAKRKSASELLNEVKKAQALLK